MMLVVGIAFGTTTRIEMEFSPDGQVLAVVSEDGTLKIIDAANMKRVFPFPSSDYHFPFI